MIGRFNLGDRVVGGGRCLVIGEVAQTHEGSLELAHRFIDALADAGVDAVKFQTHIAAAESTAAEPFRVPLTGSDATRYDYWRRMEFTADQWLELARHAKDRGVVFLSSPFSPEAVELLCRVGVPAWKIASGTLEDAPTLERIGSTGLPILLSSGLSTFEEIDRAVARVRTWNVPFLVFQTTSAYPCPPERVGLNVISELRARYQCPTGLSDHSGTVYPALAAATLGADAVEVHVCLSRSMPGPDVPSSVTTSELQDLVRGIRFIETMRANPVDKSASSAEIASLRRIFGKRVVARTAIAAGTILDATHLAAKKPGGGMTPDMITTLVGRRLRRDLQPDEPLQPGDVE